MLGDLWRGVGRRPEQAGLATSVYAEVLLQCGALSGAVGSRQHITGAQEAAKDLLSEALRVFQTLGRASKVSEAQYELSVCYWRSGALDEARVILAEATRGLAASDGELWAKILIRQSLVEVSAHRFYEAWNLLKEAEPVFEAATDVLKGRWHTQRALVLLQLAPADGQGDCVDRAVIEFTAAIFYLEQAGHERLRGNNLNNLAFLLCKLGRRDEAHEQLDRARKIFSRLKDGGSVAQVDETRARVLVAEGRHAEAKAVIAGAVRALKEGGEMALLADALAVRGIVEARLGDHDASVATFREAITVAETAGAPASAGHAALSLIEEHGRERLSEDEICETYRRADELLAHTQDPEDIARLRACARIGLDGFAGVNLPEGFLLPRAVRAYEARFIRQALLAEGGSVSRAARRLGIKHQSLAHILRTRHGGLSDVRTPVVPRRRSIIRLRDPRRAARYETPASSAQTAAILYVEDNLLVASAVKDTLEEEGWSVEVCADGAGGVSRLEGGEHYDLLLVDKDLPDIDGLDIARRARQLPHRNRVPIVMLSASDSAMEAGYAGVEVFLKKPEGVTCLVETVRRLLGGGR
ncbi:MAG: response regulator [Acidobacteria bacterium]|nr:response regulator [Acidobacteriota bacterium]